MENGFTEIEKMRKEAKEAQSAKKEVVEGEEDEEVDDFFDGGITSSITDKINYRQDMKE